MNTFWEALTNHGWDVAIFLMLAGIIGWFVRGGIKFGISMMQSKLDSFESSLKILERAAISEEGQTVSQSKQLTTITRVSEDLTKHAEKCLINQEAIRQMQNDVSEIRRDIEQFVQDGKEARKITQETVAHLGDRLDGFMERLLEIIRNLSDFGARSGRNQ